jgi:acetyl-CoA carboxylase biotin carboxyl carrier protein
VSDTPATETLSDHAGLSESELREILALVESSDVVQLDVAFASGHLSLRRNATPAPRSVLPQLGVLDGLGLAQPAEPFLAVTSPLVGIFHPAVQTGDRVAIGQLLGAIEALGMPTSVDAPAAGTVEQLLTVDGAPVEFGQSLLVLRLDHAP